MSFPEEDEFLEKFSRSEVEQDDRPNSLLQGFPPAEEASQQSDEGTPSVTSSEEDEEEPRERFKGSNEHWQKLTRPERDLAKSLDTLDAENLSNHLFNVHAWKRRARQPLQNKENKTLPALSSQDHVIASKKWVPPRIWTAWPMRVQHVPRLWERFMHYLDDVDVPGEVLKYQPKMREKPSRPLEDALLSEMLKQAREGFQAGLMQDRHEEESQERPTKRRKLDLEESIKNDSIRQQSPTDSSSSADDQKAASKREYFEEGMAEVDTAEGQPTPQDIAENKTQHDSGRDYEPVIMADEDTARTIALPSLRHTLSKLDELLMVLHHSRRYIYHPKSYKPEIPANVNHHPKKKCRTNRSDISRLRYNLRDWSEVLNAAVLAGWDREVVQRCATRCSALFGESMSFRTLEERPELFSESVTDPASSEMTQPPPLGKTNRNSEGFTSDSSQSHHVESLKSKDQDLQQTNFARPQPLYDPKLLICLIPSCKSYMQNFRTPNQLHRHLILIHNWKEQDRKLHIQENPTSYDGGSDKEMDGGVHVDGFLKPIKMRTKWVSVEPRRRTRIDNQEPSDAQALEAQDPSPASEDEA